MCLHYCAWIRAVGTVGGREDPQRTTADFKAGKASSQMNEVVRQRALRGVWTILFLAALAAVPVLNRAKVVSDPSTGDALTRYGFRLEEVSKRIGVDAV